MRTIRLPADVMQAWGCKPGHVTTIHHRLAGQPQRVKVATLHEDSPNQNYSCRINTVSLHRPADYPTMTMTAAEAQLGGFKDGQVEPFYVSGHDKLYQIRVI